MDRTLITPFFLDRPSRDHLRLGGPDAWVNQPVLNDSEPLLRLAAISEALAEAVKNAILDEDRPVSIAGDCCTVIGVMTGLQRAGLAPRLLWLDAHGDFNTYETTPSGFVGGMPLAMLVDRGDQTILDSLGTRRLAEGDVILCDARDLDPGERIAVEGSDVTHLSSINDLLALRPDGRPLHIHLDCDIVDPLDAPAMAYPAAGGPRLNDFLDVARQLQATLAPTSISMTTWTFERDTDGRTERACLQALSALLGH